MSDLVGRYLGNYHLESLIGRGAFADVYLGTHIYLATRVAIKVLRARTDALLLDRFLTEARHLSRLVHPHIIRILDIDIEDETPYLVMEYASGGNVRQLYPEGAIVPLPDVIASVSAIASALQHAHNQQIIHCDLKPENILLGDNHELLLGDFGLAWLTSDTDRRQRQVHFGTLAYMAPELIRNQPCPASDQYALAVMVYEWLHGQRPFEGSATSIVHQHLYRPPASLCELHTELPAAVEQVIFTALVKDPARRFIDVSGFASALEMAYSGSRLPELTTESLQELDDAVPESGSSVRSARVLGAPLTPLVGRDHELQIIYSRLLRQDVRLLTLIGTPGVGKTRLALALGARMREEFGQGVFFVSLAAINDPEMVMSAIAHAFGLPANETTSVFARVQQFLSEQQLLLLLDNFEQVLSAAPQLVALLEACPQVRLVVTSRFALHVQGEFEFVVSPLTVPDLNELPPIDALSQVASVALFVQRAEAIKPGFHLTAENAPLIARICALLGGIPLAIELAAVRSKLLSLQMLCTRIQQGVEVLGGGKQDLPARQQTLYSTINWSYDLLSPEDQTLFRRLCIFPGSFTLEAAEAVSGGPGALSISVLDGIASLLDKSLLLRCGEGELEPRFCLSAIVQAFGLGQLASSGELEACQQAHTAYYLGLTKQAERAMFGAEQASWLDVLEIEYAENIRPALEELLKRGELKSVLYLASSLQQFWFLRGRLEEGRAFLEQALETARQDDLLKARWIYARALYTTGYIALCQQDPEPAAAYLEASLERFRSLKDTKGAAFAQHRLGYSLAIRGEFEQGEEKMIESLQLLRGLGNWRDCADVLHSLGMLELFQGHCDEAHRRFKDALALFTSESDAWGKATELHYLAVTSLWQGEFEGARSLSNASLGLLTKLGKPSGTSEVLTVLACSLMGLGEISRAEDILKDALKQAHARESTEDLVRVLCGAAFLQLYHGNLEEARVHLEDGVTKMQGRWFDPRSKLTLCGCLRRLGESVLARGDVTWAVQLFAVAESIWSQHGYYATSDKSRFALDRSLALAHDMLGERNFAAVWAEGQSSPPSRILKAPVPISPKVEEVSLLLPTKQARSSDFSHELTARETEVLHLLAAGLTNRQIAEKLVVSPFTVNRHTQSIYNKLGINSRSAATRYALEHDTHQNDRGVLV